MAEIKSYRDLLVWQKAMDLVENVYRASSCLPKHEVYGLASQMRRSAVSVPANIAEGHGRHHTGDYLHHLSIAYRSLMELETHLLIGLRLGYLPDGDIQPILLLCAEVSRMLSDLTGALRSRQHAASS